MQKLTPDQRALISRCPLFHGIDAQSLPDVLSAPGASLTPYPKDAMIFMQESCITRIGLILSGSVRIEQTDFWGNRYILNVLGEGSIFGEAYAFSGNIPMDNDVIAQSDTVILFLPLAHLLRETAHPDLSRQLCMNLLDISSRRSRFLARKLGHLSRRTTREKLLSYLSQCARAAGRADFDIPFDRQQLSDFLSVDRSGLSTVIGRLQKEGILRADRQHFELFAKESGGEG